MKSLRLAALGAIAIALAGCAAAQLSVDTIANATVSQLQTADKLALAQTPPDLAASTCYEQMQPVVLQVQQTLTQAGLDASGLAAVPGPVDFQIVRDGVKAGLSGKPALLLDAFNKSCGWLKADAEKDVITLGIKVAPLGIKLPF